MTQKEMQSILEIGTAISSEKDYNRLLEMILNRIMELTHADAGTLYLADGMCCASKSCATIPCTPMREEMERNQIFLRLN